MTVLAARVAYPLWAGTYDTETALSALDELAVAALSPPRFTRLLDAACGTGRRMPREGFAAGIDLVPEMLALARRRAAGRLAAADLAALPFHDRAFDLVWCRLAVGHLRRLDEGYREMVRVLAPGGTLVISDLHPEAARRGAKRTFRDAGGVKREVEHHLHEDAAHLAAARNAGLLESGRDERGVGPDVESFFRQAGALDAYQTQRGLPMLLALRFTRTGS